MTKITVYRYDDEMNSPVEGRVGSPSKTPRQCLKPIP